MSYEVEILVKEFIPETESIPKMEAIVKSKGWNFSKELRKDGSYLLSANNDKEDEELEGIYIYMLTQEQYEYYKDDLDYSYVKEGYHALMTIDYHFGGRDEHMLIPFVKALMKVYPGMILYFPEHHYEDTLRGIHEEKNFMSYTKEKLEKYLGTSSDGLMSNPYME